MRVDSQYKSTHFWNGMKTSIELAQLLIQRFPNHFSPPTEFRGEISLKLKNAQDLLEVMSFAKSNLEFDFLVDITAVDHMGEEPRFELVYQLYSTSSHQYLRIKTTIGEEKAEVFTVSGIWRTADWHEREAFDLMGIRFTNHPDLRRILMWDSYPHHPLRKDFPLAGLPTEDGRARPVPLNGGPFVTSPGNLTTVDREPHGKGQ